MKNLTLLLLSCAVFIASCKKDDDNKNDGGGNNNTSSCSGGQTTVTDIDGNVYNVVTIGNQCWMKENLKTTRYRNGDLIPLGLSDTQWENTNSGACDFYNNNAQYNNPYGKLYNGYAMADQRGLCPTGWHVASENDWNSMVNILGGDNIAGGKMKLVGDLQSGTGFWQAPNTGATNSSGFSGPPGGYRNPNGSYSQIGNQGYWWTPSSTNFGAIIFLEYNSGNATVGGAVPNVGFSVRCVKD